LFRDVVVVEDKKSKKDYLY